MRDSMEKRKITVDGQYHTSELGQLKGSNQIEMQREVEGKCTLTPG